MVAISMISAPNGRGPCGSRIARRVGRLSSNPGWHGRACHVEPARPTVPGPRLPLKRHGHARSAADRVVGPAGRAGVGRAVVGPAVCGLVGHREDPRVVGDGQAAVSTRPPSRAVSRCSDRQDADGPTQPARSIAVAAGTVDVATCIRWASRRTRRSVPPNGSPTAAVEHEKLVRPVDSTDIGTKTGLH